MVLPDRVITPFSHLRVLDLANETASYCSKILASLGASVIKIEKPGGDSSRAIGPFLNNLENPENSLSFWFNNTNKLGITLNLDTKKGRDIFRKLASTADVILETFTPGYLKRKHLDYTHLSEINPRLIIASVTSFGQTGPYRSYSSCDIIASAAGGQMYVIGAPDASPLKPYGEQSYYIASLYAAIAILIAFHDRNKTNKGQHIDISLQETTVATLEHSIVRLFSENIVSKRSASIHWSNMAGIFPCKDGYIFLSFEREWDTLIDWLASEHAEADLREEIWNNPDYRRQYFDHIIKIVTKWTKMHTVAELFETAQLMRFPWAPVQNVHQLLDNPQLSERRFFTSVHHDNIGKSFIYPDVPLKFFPNPQKPAQRAPLIGEHNYKIYREELGIPEKQLARLARLNII